MHVSRCSRGLNSEFPFIFGFPPPYAWKNDTFAYRRTGDLKDVVLCQYLVHSDIYLFTFEA